MKPLLKVFTGLLAVIVVLYGIICLYFYYEQDSMIFPASKLESNHQFKFDAPFKAYSVKTGTDTLSGILFETDNPKGLIFYLHGNGGTVEDWGIISPLYTRLGYNLFILDYPGYGKSTGEITSEQQLFAAIQTAYDTVKADHANLPTVFMGYSIGTGMATWMASKNDCKKVVMMAPYYSLPHLVSTLYPYLPTFILKYQFATNQYLPQVKAPVVIFHGDDDRLIHHNESLKLKSLFKSADRLIILKGQGHNEIQRNPVFQSEIEEILR